MTTKTKYPITSIIRATRFGAISILFAVSLHAQGLTDHFTGSEINTSIWETHTTHGPGSASVDNSIVTLDVGPGATTSGNRTALISRKSDFNPFANELVIRFNGLTINNSPADPGNAGWGNGFYVAVGRADGDTGSLDADAKNKYANVGGSYVSALGLTLRQSESAFYLQVIDRGMGNHTTTSFTLSNAPTDLVWTIDGTDFNSSWSIELTGAVFSDTNLNTINGSFYRFTEEGLDTGDNNLISRLALGAINIGNVGDASIATLDSVSVVPESASIALIFAGAAIVIVLLRRSNARN